MSHFFEPDLPSEARFNRGAYKSNKKTDWRFVGFIIFSIFVMASILTAITVYNVTDGFPVALRTGIVAERMTSETVSSVRLIAPPGELSYYVKIVSASSGRVVIEAFIEPGFEISDRMEEGDYILKIAMGKTWKGDDNLFGRKTYFFTTGIFHFESSSPYSRGVNIDLAGLFDGTIAIAKIEKEKF